MTDMHCIICGGRCEWRGPLSDPTHTVCQECGSADTAVEDDEDDQEPEK